MTQRIYSDELHLEAVIRVQAGESQREVSRTLGIPLATVHDWYSEAEAAAGRVHPKDPPAVDHAALWASANEIAAKRIISNVAGLPETGLKPHEIRDIAIVGGISVDKHLDYRDGRKGAQVPNVDARQLHFHVTPEQARALLEEATRLAPPAALQDGSVSSSSEPLSLP